ncbi:MAG: four-carbon acid sugar kinase family protein [Thermoanaerobacteraceae bacterium]|nr:four-carbon acid sugar kinase family protein [Thermoanaerobacteraceae bacterium]
MTILPVVIIADGLTGACDAAAQFLPQIRPIKVWTEVPSEISRDLRSYRVISLNTQTRDLSPHSAGEICRAAGHLLRVSGVRSILIKKIDTAFRGNVGIEIERLLDSLGLKAAVVIPSIPDLGRTNVNGVQLLEGRPIHEFFAEDPTYKLRTSKVTELISRSTRLPVGNVPLNVVRKVKEIRPAVEQALKAGFRIIVFDAASNEDIDRTVYSLLSDGLSFLFVGSLGLTAAISRYLLGARGTGHGPIHGAQTPGRGARGEPWSSAAAGTGPRYSRSSV